MGMFGLVGWSVAIPTLLGVALGWWLDDVWPQDFSWTLTFLIVGLGVGCLNAWFWVRQESRRE
jgi:ATP synthase protein I